MSDYMGLLHDAGLATVYERDIHGLNDLLNKMGERGLPIDQQKRLAVATELGEQRAALLIEMEALLPPKGRRYQSRKTRPKVLDGWVEFEMEVEGFTCGYCSKWNPNKKHPCFKTQPVWKHNATKFTTGWQKPIPFTPSLDMLKRYCLAKGYKIPTRRYKQTGLIRQTMDETAIRRMALSHPDDKLFGLVLEYREKDKQLGTYTGRIVE